MKTVFVGPSLPAASAADIEVRPPAVQGDILRAVRSGASAIGLIDGNFEYAAPVWHKEILFALSHGIRVYGAASMGALRAAECAAFGMVGIGKIFEDYASGRLVDDADVALLHGPPELGWLPLTVPMVNICATLAHLADTGAIGLAERVALAQAASRIFYKDRTWAAVVAEAALPASSGRPALLDLLRSETVDAKADDARLLLSQLAIAPPERSVLRPAWTFHATSMWDAIDG